MTRHLLIGGLLVAAVALAYCGGDNKTPVPPIAPTPIPTALRITGNTQGLDVGQVNPAGGRGHLDRWDEPGRLGRGCLAILQHLGCDRVCHGPADDSPTGQNRDQCTAFGPNQYRRGIGPSFRDLHSPRNRRGTRTCAGGGGEG